jgi:murein DD-endopeptidase MepM/ murein hydrolase activator NlpD
LLRFFREKLKKIDIKGFFKKPLFYFGCTSVLLFLFLCIGSDSLAQMSYVKNSDAVFFNPFFKNSTIANSNDLFFNQNKGLTMETPDLKIAQDDFMYGISTPDVLTTQTLGAIFGGSSQQNKDVVNYVVQPGDTIASVAQSFNITNNTVIWANNLSAGARLTNGQTLVILPVSGVIHVVRPGDTISQISKTYKANPDDIVAFNNLANEEDVFVGDILIVPGGVMPAIPVQGPEQVPLADNFFIYPAEGQITQGLHYYNAVDLANKCGTSIYAAAAGIVQRTVGNGGWNLGMGNYITILHADGIVTYYGHLQYLYVKVGDKVNVGDRIALMGRTGDATGCHVHFEVIGAKNPLAKYPVGTHISYTQH